MTIACDYDGVMSLFIADTAALDRVVPTSVHSDRPLVRYVINRTTKWAEIREKHRARLDVVIVGG